MEFEWDEHKRAQIIAERALDFAFARLFFDSRPAIQQPSPRGGEERLEDDSDDGRRDLHFDFVLARRGSSGHFNEAGT